MSLAVLDTNISGLKIDISIDSTYIKLKRYCFSWNINFKDNLEIKIYYYK